MKKYLFVAFMTMLLASCAEKQDEIPANVLSIDKMVNVMIDIQLLEGAFANKNLARDTAVFLYNQYEKDLFRKHEISDSTYRKSFAYYSSHPQTMDKIYEMIVDSLSLREGQKRL